MSEIQGGRWDGWLRRLFSIKASSIAPAMGAEIIPTAAVVPPRAEDRILRGDKMYWGGDTSGAVAGQFSHVNLRNDSDNQIVTIDAVVFRGLVNTTAQFRLGNTVVGTGGITVGGRDTRLGLTLLGSKQAGTIRTGSAVAITGTFVATITYPQWDGLIWTVPIVLGPSDMVILWNTVANTQLDVSFCWTEREAEPGELNLQY